MPDGVMTRRTFLSRSTMLGAVALGGPTLLSACGTGGQTNTLERLQEQGFIRVGFANEAPYGFADESGKLTGESPEVARVVLQELGIEEMDGVLTEFASLIPGLRARRFDMVAAGMFITPKRCEQVLFSDPSYCAPQAFLVKAGNPLGITDYKSVAAKPDVRLGVLTGAVEGKQAQSAGVAAGQLSEFPNPPSLLEALQADRIDAVALTTISLNNLLETAGGTGLEVTEPFVPVIDGEEQLGCGGFAFRPDDEAFRDAVNEVLVGMKEQGEVAPITSKFGFAEAAELAKDKTVHDLCPEAGA